MAQLIRHNQRKKAEQIFNNAKDIRIYTLDNHFSGVFAQKLDYNGRNWLLREWLSFNFARLTEEGQSKFCLYIHNNCWYNFQN